MVGRLRGFCVGPPTAFTVWAPVYRGCPCQDPPVCHRVQGDSVAKRQHLLCVVGVVTSCVPCARARTSRSCATENTYTPARLEALFKLSVVTILNHSYQFTNFSAGCGCSIQLVILLKISSKCFCLLSAVSQLVLFTHMQICFFGFFNNPFLLLPQRFRSGSCLNLCKSHTGPHVFLRRFPFRWCELCEY